MNDNETAPRYRPGGPEKKRETPEEERERYYTLMRAKFHHESLRKLSWVNIAIVGSVLGAFFLGAILLEKPTESALEKRDLARMPAFSAESLFKGSLSRDIETFFSDTFPLRDALVGLSAVVDECRGIRVDDVRIVAPSGGEAQDIPPEVYQQQENDMRGTGQSGDSSDVPANSRTDDVSGDVSSDVTSVSSGTPSSQFSPKVAETPPGEINNGTFVYKGMAMSLFGGNPESGAWYADVLNAYQQELPDVQIYNMIIPTSIEFNVPDKYRDLTQSQKNMIDYVYSNLAPSIKRVDAYAQLEQHRDEYIYFRTDHHWTGLGAYYAYVAFCEQAGFTPASLNSFETRTLDNFIGTMYGQTQDTTLLNNPDYVDYYIFPREYTATRNDRSSPYSSIPHTLWGEYAQSPNSYSVFLHGDFPLISIKTDINNGRKVLIVKESFGNAFAPFLVNNYEEVYIVDQRYFELSLVDFIKQNGIKELIFANNSFAVCTPYHIRCIDNMRHQWSATPPPALPPQESPVETPVESQTEEELVPASSMPEYAPVPEEDSEEAETREPEKQRPRVRVKNSDKDTSSSERLLKPRSARSSAPEEGTAD